MKHGPKPVILVVDDDESVLISLQAWLESEGFKVLTAENTDEALNLLEKETVEVALLDFRLKTENGLTAAERLKEAGNNMKIIIITGYPSHEAAVESIKSGIFDYISKDTSNEKILETINKAIDTRHREMVAKGEAVPRPPFLKFIVICRHSFIKERLRNFSSSYPDFRLIKTYNSIEDLNKAHDLPGIDIAMICASCCIDTFEDSFHFFNTLYKQLPTIKPIIFNDNFTDHGKVDLIRIGVKGFFSIEMDSKKLEKALTLIKNGELWTTRRLAHMAIPSGPEYLKDYITEEPNIHGLSVREKDILKAIFLGLKNREIAEKLFIHESTVKSHINRIYKKFGVDNRARAILFAQENNIL